MVGVLVCKPSCPGSITGMSSSESAMPRGNPIMLLPSTKFHIIHAYVFVVNIKIFNLTQYYI
jgi:hypothetical protein